MRVTINLIIALMLVLLLVIVGYYMVTKKRHEGAGESYNLPAAARQLWHDVFGGSSDREGRDPDGDPETHPPPAEPGDAQPPAQGVTRATWDEGLALYALGEFEAALPLLAAAHAAGVSPRGEDAADTIALARVCTELFSAEPAGAALSGPPCAIIAPPSGDAFLAEVVAENDREIRFRRGTMIFTVPKAKLSGHHVARTEAEKRALGQKEYRRRREEAEQARPPRAADFLGLARFCRAWGLLDKVGFCMRQGLAARGDEIEEALYLEFERARSGGEARRATALRDLLRRFYPDGEYTRKSWQVARQPGVPLGPSPGAPDPPSGIDRPSGIGEAVPREVRNRDPKLQEMLTQADRLRSEGNEHYRKARPGSPNAAVHRKKALDAYNKAFELFEQIEERWDVDLDRIFKEIMERRYQLMKDSTLR